MVHRPEHEGLEVPRVRTTGRPFLITASFSLGQVAFRYALGLSACFPACHFFTTVEVSLCITNTLIVVETYNSPDAAQQEVGRPINIGRESSFMPRQAPLIANNATGEFSHGTTEQNPSFFNARLMSRQRVIQPPARFDSVSNFAYDGLMRVHDLPTDSLTVSNDNINLSFLAPSLPIGNMANMVDQPIVGFYLEQTVQ